MANRNYFVVGLTEMLMLAILRKGDSYVYDISKSISAFSDGMIQASQNTIYSITYKMVDAGYISEYTKLVGRRRTRVYYHLEPKGQEYLDELEKKYFDAVASVQKIYDALDARENE